MGESKAQKVIYKGQIYQSMLEGRIAVFLDAANIPFEYEADKVSLKGGHIYTPDFKIADAYIAGDQRKRYVWIEGKQVLWDHKDERKLIYFSGMEERIKKPDACPSHPVLVVSDIPKGQTVAEVANYIYEQSRIPLNIVDKDLVVIDESIYIFPFNSNTVSFRFSPATMCIRRDGHLYLGGIDDDVNTIDTGATLFAYSEARNVRLEPVIDSLPTGDYYFTICDVSYNPDLKTTNKCAGMNMKLKVSYKSQNVFIQDWIALDGNFSWKYKDLCASLGVPYCSSIISKDSQFWSDIVNKQGRAWITPYDYKNIQHCHIECYWPIDGSCPLAFNGENEWNRRRAAERKT